MIVQQIRALAQRLSTFLEEFGNCFRTPETRQHLNEYVRGQLCNLPRKSVEPIAHLADVPPRTLQEFLSLSQWDHDRLRDTVQHIVARDHAEPQAIGIIDESGHPKKGRETACVHRQYCGASGKVDNCVMGVHLCHVSFDGSGDPGCSSAWPLDCCWPWSRPWCSERLDLAGPSRRREDYAIDVATISEQHPTAARNAGRCQPGQFTRPRI